MSFRCPAARRKSGIGYDPIRWRAEGVGRGRGYESGRRIHPACEGACAPAAGHDLTPGQGGPARVQPPPARVRKQRPQKAHPGPFRRAYIKQGAGEQARMSRISFQSNLYKVWSSSFSWSDVRRNRETTNLLMGGSVGLKPGLYTSE